LGWEFWQLWQRASGVCLAGLPDFSWYNIPKREKMYQTATKYTKWPQNIQNDIIMFVTAIKYSNICHSMALKNVPKL
jgi:hypothetical protein